MQALAHDTRLGPDVTGTAIVATDLLRKKLGYSAFLVWQILCDYRDEEGLVNVSKQELSRTPGFSKLNRHTLRDALRRLHAAKLVLSLQRHPVKSGLGVCYFRKVFGATAEGVGQSDVCLVPTGTWRWMQTAVHHGGARPGAGRKSSTPHPPEAPNNQAPPTPRSRSNPRKNQAPPTLQKESSTPSPPLESSTPHPPSAPNVDGGFLEKPLVGAKESSTPRVIYNKQGSQDVVLSEQHAPPAAAPPRLVCGADDTGWSLGSSTAPTLRALIDGHDGIPARPTATRLPLPALPSPPKLPADLPDLDAARWLLNSYRGAVTSRYKKPCMMLIKAGELARSRYLPLLVAAARAMREYDVAPAAWVAWSVDLWRSRTDAAARKPPPLGYVFSAKRVEEKHGWFRKEAGAYDGGRLVSVESAQALRQRWATMWWQLCTLRDRSPERIREVVALHFPGDTYERMIQTAKAEALDAQASLNQAAQSGRWIGW